MKISAMPRARAVLGLEHYVQEGPRHNSKTTALGAQRTQSDVVGAAPDTLHILLAAAGTEVC